MGARVVGSVLLLILGSHGALADERKPAHDPWAHVTEWANLPVGRTRLEPSDYHGRTLFLLLHQPGDANLEKRVLPVVRRLASHLARNKHVAFLALELTPAGRPASREPVGALLRRNGLEVPCGREGALGPGTPGLRSAYSVRATPWAVVIDAHGIVRAAGPARPFEEERRSIGAAFRATQPNHAMVGTPFGSLAGLRWLPAGTPPHRFAGQRLTLVRWWTSHCPHCAASVPDLSKLAQRHGRDLAFVGIYHRKSRRRLSDAAIARTFRGLGGAGVLAVDEGWRLLKPMMERGALRRATSISFLVDAAGVIRWVHPGPRVHHSRERRYQQVQRDMTALALLVAGLLNRPAPQSSAGPSGR